LNSLFLEDSADSGDLADEFDEFFGFMICHDLSGEGKEGKSSFTEDEKLGGSISATDLFATF
jgi:hypothetical protein